MTGAVFNPVLGHPEVDMSFLSVLLPFLLPARAELPLPLWPDCGEPQQPELCPDDLDEAWNYVSYVREEWQDTVREAEHEMGTGLWADRAWRWTTGSTEVVIAVLDSGIEWDHEGLVNKHFLNPGELPLPEYDGTEAADWDADGNGLVNIQDYAADPRVDPTAGVDEADHLLDPSDLIHTFSDGVDDDGNGFVDDIAGWDFMWNDNDPYDDTRYGHGTGEAEDSAEEGGDGGDIGVCPNCMVLNVRVGDSFVADGANFASGVLYAVDMGAHVVQEALGTLDDPTYVRDALDHAWENGVTVVASAADETAWHPNFPGANPHTVYVHAIRYDADDRDDATTFLAYSNCTNHGARLDLSAPSTSCSSGATGVTAGVAGLLHSAAVETGRVLTANEAWQLLVGTADDIDVEESREGETWYPSKPGWDRYFGRGRVNAESVVAAVFEDRIPPEVEIRSPEWFALVDPAAGETVEVIGHVRADRASSATWTLEVAEGLDPEDDAFRELASGSAPVQGVLATFEPGDLDLPPASTPVTPYPADHDQVDREEAVNAWTFTLRLRATDDEGLSARVRRVLYAHRDPDLLEGWPLALGAGSLEASPKLFDMDGDGTMEVIQGTADGALYVLDGKGTPLPGWPVHTELLEEVDPDGPAPHLDAPAWDDVDPERYAPITGTPAVGDLDGDGSPEIVAGDLRGALWIWSADGGVSEGFPVYQEPVPSTDPDHLWDEGFLSSPALGDLDGDGDLEIVVGGMDQYVYAWHHDGEAVEGWPVLARHPDYPEAGNRIISSPAVGDLDGDGREDVVIGTNEVLDGYHNAIYAFSGTGEALEGWPVTLTCLYSEVLPYVGEGMPVSPALGDLDGDGDLEVVTHGLGGSVEALHHDGEQYFAAEKSISQYGSASNVTDASVLPLNNSPSIGDVDGDGTPDVACGGAGSDYAMGHLEDGQRIAFDHALSVWDGRDGELLSGFPQVMEDLQFFQSPAIADLDGDGRVEVINGSGGFLLHAWNEDGEEPEGWPRFTGHWILASPAVGDIDGDGFLEVVVGTRRGDLFAWRTESPLGATVEWASFGRDPGNRSNHADTLSGYEARASSDTGGAEAAGCGCGTARAPVSAVWVLWVPAVVGGRRRRGFATRGGLRR